MKLQKADFLFITVLFAGGFLLALLIYFPRSAEGAYVQIRINGDVTATYPLAKNYTETLHTTSGENTFTIHDGIVSMSGADCPDQVCVRTRQISHAGETIVCLPHKLVLEIVSAPNNNSPIDAITGGAP